MKELNQSKAIAKSAMTKEKEAKITIELTPKTLIYNLLIGLRNIIIISIIFIVAIGIYATKIEPNWIEIVNVNINIPELPTEFKNFKIVQISDLHTDDSMNQKKLSRVINLVNLQQPDIIALTGDFFSREPNEESITLLETNLANLLAKEKILAVLGNHDHYYNTQIIKDILKRDKILELDNSVYTVQRGENKLNIAGVDDYWKQKSRLDLVIEQLPKERIAILLAHEPDFADVSSATNRFILQMSGHSHGGQVRIPYQTPPKLPPLGRKYPIGLYKVGNMIQYTNRGLGMVRPLVRFGSRPEITVFTLAKR